MEMQDGLSTADSAEFVLRGRPLKLGYRSLLSSFVTEAGCPGEIPLFDIVRMLESRKETDKYLPWTQKEESWRINIEMVPEEKLAQSTEPLQVLLDASMENLNLEHEYELVEAPAGFHERVQGLPTRHIVLRQGEIGKPWVQAFVKRHVCTLGLQWLDAVRHLPTLLAPDLPSSSPLRHFLFYVGLPKKVFEHQLVLRVLKSASEFLGDIGVAFLDVELPCRPHDFDDFERDFEPDVVPDYFDASTYLAVSSPYDSAEREIWGVVEVDFGKTEQMLFVRFCFVDETAGIFLRALKNPSCALTRLDLRGSQYTDKFSDKFLRGLATAISSIKDLGLDILSEHKMQILLDSRIHTRVLTLRIRFHDFYSTEECWQRLVEQGLADSSCTLQFLDCLFLDCPFLDIVWPPLVQSNTAATLKALRITCHSAKSRLGSSSSLTEYLSCCSLVCLEVISGFTSADDEWEWANSLMNNFCLLSLAMPWQNEAAEAHAASFIRRNNLYAAGQLLKEPHVQPSTAKLFVCGHAEVGKTTLCRALRSVSKNRWWTSLVVWTRAPKRTRGIEFHSLGFRGTKKKLLICDLAGQEEFHVLHHYFVKANNNDLFIVVCKVDTSSSQQEFQCQLDYWLRFIVSHRSTRFNASLAKPNQR